VGLTFASRGSHWLFILRTQCFSTVNRNTAVRTAAVRGAAMRREAIRITVDLICTCGEALESSGIVYVLMVGGVDC